MRACGGKGEEARGSTRRREELEEEGGGVGARGPCTCRSALIGGKHVHVYPGEYLIQSVDNQGPGPISPCFRVQSFSACTYYTTR